MSTASLSVNDVPAEGEEKIEVPSSTLQAEKLEVRKRTHKPLLYIGMMSMVMLFAGLTSAVFVRRAEGNWPFDLYISCIIMLLSSATLVYASKSAKKNNSQGVKIGVIATLVLGIAFVMSQFSAYGALVDGKMFFAGPGSNASWAYLYVLVGLHLAHLFGGIIMMMITTVNALKEKYNSTDAIGLELASIYWHFLDVLWIYLFLFLFLMI